MITSLALDPYKVLFSDAVSLRQRGSQTLNLREFRRSGPLLLAYQVDSGVRQARKELTMDLLARLELRVTQIVDTDAQHVFSLQLQSYCGRVLLR